MRSSFSLVLSLLIPCALAAQEKHTLRYAFQPGQTSWVELTQDMSQHVKVGEREMGGKMTLTMWMENKVTDVKDGVATFESRYARMVIKSDLPGQKIDYDSDVEGSKAGPMRDVARLVGGKVKVRVDAMGKVQEVDVPDDLEGVAEKAGFSMQQSFEQQFVPWPQDAVAIGDTWKSEMDMPMGAAGTSKAAVTNKLVAKKDQVVTVEQSMVVDTSALTLPQGMKMEVSKAGGATKCELTNTAPIDGTMDLALTMGPSTMAVRMAIKRVEAPAPKAAAKPADKPAEKPAEKPADKPQTGGK